MDYEELDRYHGVKTCCDNCNREFLSGEIVTVDPRQDLVFCYSDDGGGCMVAWVFSNVRVVIGTAMRFGDGYLIEEMRTPNYPKIPVLKDPNPPGTPLQWAKDLLKNI